MRFVCDHDVDAAVAKMLRSRGHDAWTVGVAGLALAVDDALTAYADDHDAALVTHDVEFSTRRRRNVVGQHIWLRCLEYDAVDLLEKHLDEILALLATRKDVWVRVSHEGVTLSFAWE